MLTAHNCWCNFGKGYYEEHIFKIIIILVYEIQWMWFKDVSILSAGGHYFQ